MAAENVSSLGTYAIVIVVAAVTIFMGAAILTGLRPHTLGTQTITGEKEAGTDIGTLPTVITVDVASNTGFQGVKSDSETLYWEDNGTSNTTLTQGDNYTVQSYSDGEFNLTTLGDWDSTNDNIYLDYQYSNDTTATGAVDSAQEGNQTFADFIPIIALVAAAAIIMAILLSQFGGMRR